MNFQKIYSKAQKRRTPVPPQRDLSDSEEGNGLYKQEGGVRKQEDVFIGEYTFPGETINEDSGNGTAADEDSNSSENQNFDAKLSRASSLYQGPSSGQCSPAFSHKKLLFTIFTL